MILFPAIDLIDGKVVRLERGDRGRMKVYSDDPVAIAREFSQAGARWIHVVDLPRRSAKTTAHAPRTCARFARFAP